MTGEVQEQDAKSGLVDRSWVRTSRRRGKLTERTLEGEQVKTGFFDPHGDRQGVAGTVIRNAAGNLVVESFVDGIRRETAVPRDASVDRISR